MPVKHPASESVVYLLLMTRREYYWLNDRPLQWMFKVSATGVDASMRTLVKADDWVLKNTHYENLNIFKSAQ